MKKRSWKTTLVSFMLSIAVAVQPLLDGREYEWTQLAIAALIAVLGCVMKDYDVTGVPEE